MSRVRDIWKASQQARRIVGRPRVVVELACKLPITCAVDPLVGEARRDRAECLTLAAKARQHGHVENWIEHMAWAICYRKHGIGFEYDPGRHLAHERRMLRRHLAKRLSERTAA